ncbi:PREDICTED: uncharacterized protein LOC105449845 [Wasmannia auropunctata]|uniref:uncharacterized protein LOC105449845 n=1 Tax=Wasmannia auropunctata TaxID=64793 RepID=UPI0005EEB92E|nr:PREDICTED: uncharacterized protein LOC105449845 [Wasmannia auropunctata]
MPRVFVCLFALFILSIAVQFGDCQKNITQLEREHKNIIPGSDEPRLSSTERVLKIWHQRSPKKAIIEDPVYDEMPSNLPLIRNRRVTCDLLSFLCAARCRKKRDRRGRRFRSGFCRNGVCICTRKKTSSCRKS